MILHQGNSRQFHYQTESGSQNEHYLFKHLAPKMCMRVRVHEEDYTHTNDFVNCISYWYVTDVVKNLEWKQLGWKKWSTGKSNNWMALCPQEAYNL